MRVMLVALLLAVVGAGVAVALELGERDERGVSGVRPHLPRTPDEKAAAAGATAYVRAILQSRADRAWEHAAGATFRKLGCARRHPRIPATYRLYPDGRLRVEHVG